MSQIAIVSDIHGNLPALERVMDDIHSRQVEMVFNLGDHLSGPLYPRETAALLQKTDWIHVLGNHDRALFTQDPSQQGLSDGYAFRQLGKTDLDWLRSLPPVFRSPEGWLCLHGAPIGENVFLLETAERGRARLSTIAEIEARLDGQTASLILCGHSHVARVVTLPDGRLIVNPGSVGLQAYDDDFPEPLVIETGSPCARYALMTRVGDAWKVVIVNLAYDHEAAARQAGRNSRPEWEYALRTGFVPKYL